MHEAAPLTELERDALTEIVNIGVSRAASGLRGMIGDEVILSVPAVEVVDMRTAASLLDERETGELVAVRQDFDGAFSGRALLIFPQNNSRLLLRALLGPDTTDDELAAMEQEALAETGNVILNATLGTMANMLRRSLSMSLPAVITGPGPALLQLDHAAAPDGLVLFLYINFSIRQRAIRGYIAMLMDLPSLTSLRRVIGDFIASVMSDDAGADS